MAMGMNGLFYLAGGLGPHPTIVLLHGFPGNEQNLDLAQAIRRAGWNVLTMHYRGSWGSPGVFSIAHVLEDVDAAVAFVREPEVATKYGIDTRRIVLGGHSMGGLRLLRTSVVMTTFSVPFCSTPGMPARPVNNSARRAPPTCRNRLPIGLTTWATRCRAPHRSALPTKWWRIALIGTTCPGRKASRTVRCW